MSAAEPFELVGAPAPQVHVEQVGPVPVPVRRTGRRVLDRRRILAAALELIDEDGIDAFTMRRLGAHLGVEAMAVYRYVRSREDVLDGVVETVAEELSADPEVWTRAEDGWQDYLVRLAHGLRRMALAHPDVLQLMAARPRTPRWSRPPLQSLRWVESFLDALTGSGFSPAEAVAAYRRYTSLLLGHLFLEVAQRAEPTSRREQPAPGRDGVLRCHPTTSRLEGRLRQDVAAAEFDAVLESLVERLERRLQADGAMACRPAGASGRAARERRTAG